MNRTRVQVSTSGRRKQKPATAASVKPRRKADALSIEKVIVYFVFFAIILSVVTFSVMVHRSLNAAAKDELQSPLVGGAVKASTIVSETNLGKAKIEPLDFSSTKDVMTPIPTLTQPERASVMEDTNLIPKYSSKPDGEKKDKKKKEQSKKEPKQKKKSKGILWPDILVEPEYGYEKHIQLMPIMEGKTGIKRDRRIIFPDLVYKPLSRPEGEPSGIVEFPRGYVKAKSKLDELPLFDYYKSAGSNYPSLDETMVHLYNLDVCRGKPVFLSMASVGDDLYWQLIENFVYTMVKFNTVQCSLVICVSDSNCMRLCNELSFPCYNFRTNVYPLPSVMEQIGEVKLLHVPKALSKGVDVFMLDLDVGFLYDPMVMVDAFMATPKVDIFVQEDLIFLMNRTKAGWRTWFTQPLPNIGLFLCRGNNKTEKVFSMAWEKYQKMEDPEDKKNPGKDQNHVLDAMRFGRAKFYLRYAYFSNSTAVLLDKMTLYNNRSVELGGTMADLLLSSEQMIAAHMTCYEHTTKVLGLKVCTRRSHMVDYPKAGFAVATNAYWNPKYYDPQRPTITKPILFLSDFKHNGEPGEIDTAIFGEQVLEEVRSLIWLALNTNRAVIVPNLLGHERGVTGAPYMGQMMWPGFRVVKMKREDGRNVVKVDILEPAYYWRVQRDYDDAPEPKIVYFDPKTETLENVRDSLQALGDDYPRVVLHAKFEHEDEDDVYRRAMLWAEDSVGLWELPFSLEKNRYGELPSLKKISRSNQFVSEVFQGMRNCEDIFGPPKGNRTCFQICE